MKVYLIAHIEVTNPELMEKYRAQVPEIVAKYQGKYLVRGGETDVIEGDYFKHRIVLLEFPNKECANNFYKTLRTLSCFSSSHPFIFHPFFSLFLL